MAEKVVLENDSKSRVAYDLMKRIANSETDTKPKDRQYWLALYSECWNVAAGGSPK